MSPTPGELDALLAEADRTMAELLVAEPGRAHEAALDAAQDAHLAYLAALEEASTPEPGPGA